MKPPIFVRTLSKEESEALEAGLRSSDAFVLRRCQILLASARGERPPRIAENLRCGSQTLRNAIHDFNEKGLDALMAGSSRPRDTYTPPSMRTGPRPYGRSSTKTRETSARKIPSGH
jgi:hypothetical protein